MPIEASEWWVHLGCAFLALSYLSTAMAPLRILAGLAAACGIAWFAVHGAAPDWMPILWLAILSAINLLRLVELLVPRLNARFDPELRALAEGPFAGLEPRVLEHLSRIGFWRDLKDGHMLICEGQRVDAVHLVAAGGAQVTIRGRAVATLQPGSFAGEMSFLSGAPASATVITAGPARVFSLRQDSLARAIAEDASLRAAVQQRFGRDVAAKLRAADGADA